MNRFNDSDITDGGCAHKRNIMIAYNHLSRLGRCSEPAAGVARSHGADLSTAVEAGLPEYLSHLLHSRRRARGPRLAARHGCLDRA
jgi:hypothetical protein